MGIPYRHPRGTRAALNAKATAGTLVVGQVYVITDESRLAVALTASTYETYAKASEIAPRGIMWGIGGKGLASDADGLPVYNPRAFTASTAASFGSATVAATNANVFSIRRAGSQVGTATYSPSATVPVFAFSDTNFVAGSYLLVPPSTPDPTLAGVLIAVREA